ncbi:Arm DNA-binding domain-containing protein [Faecalibacterium prausnitzii]|uniref:Arm DNA-binding domain-containing protein n=1 Tax=Faecalibacterium prausnitzii TaxID=853 RepID=UPI00207A0691|nr:Arm DNA-binding domain-containing protein [Faecalibacterium prausnitzii]
MAYITKRGSSYGVRYTYQDEQGKNCNKWESFSTKEEAINRKKQIEHELANGMFLIPSTITVKEFLMEWLPKQCNKHKWAPCTYQSNLGTVQNLIIPYIGDMQMQKLKPTIWKTCILPSAKRPAASIMRAKSRCFQKNNSSGFSPARPSTRYTACCGQRSSMRWSGASSPKAPFRWTAPRNRFRSAPSGARTRCGPHLPAWRTRFCIWQSILRWWARCERAKSLA